MNRTNAHRAGLPAADFIRGVAIHRVAFIDLRFYKPSALPMDLLRRFDILHVHGAGALLDCIVMTKPLHRRPIVLSTHGGIFHTPSLALLKQAYFFGLQRLLMKRVDIVAACSRDDERLFRRVAPRVMLLENAIDAERFLLLPLNRKVPGRCLYAGRLSPNKGLLQLLHAFARAAAVRSQCHLRLVGRDVDGCRAPLEQAANRLGVAARITFAGEVSDEALTQEFEAAELFLSASRYEGFGLSALEAKAAGCRLVLHSNAAFKQLFANDRQVRLVDFDDAAAACDAIIEALKPVDQSALQSSRHEVAVYSWQRKLSDWLSLYEQLARPAQESTSLAH